MQKRATPQRGGKRVARAGGNPRQNDKTERVGYDTQKPLALIERIVKVSSNEGDLVADFFLGSGTTAVACKKLNRHFIGCDISEKAVDIANSRLDKTKCIQL